MRFLPGFAGFGMTFFKKEKYNDQHDHHTR